jgi:hypothetical protein
MDKAPSPDRKGKAMIPELGHFALVVALALALAQAVLASPAPPPAARADRDRAPDRHRPVPLRGGAFAALARCFVGNDFSVRERRDQLQLEAAHGLPLRRDLGLARGLDAAVDADARRLDLRGRDLQPPPARAHGGARARRDGPR